jgi:hypothetical protein
VFSHSYNHAKANLDKFRVVEMLPELVVNGVAFDGGAPYAGGRKGVEKTHMLFAPFILNGETHVAEIIIHQYGAESTATGTDKQAYNIKSVKIKNLGAGTGLAPSPALTSLRHSQDSMSIGELAGLVKSAWPDAKMDGLQASTGAEPAAQAKLTRVLASFMFNRFINELRGAAEASGERLADAQLRFGDQDAGMDLLDVIEAHGGVKSPAAMKNPGGEYDGFAGAFGRGAARRLVRRNGGGSAVDVLIEELRESGYNFESADAFYEAVAYAVRLREEKRANAKALKKEERREAGRLRKMDNVGSRMASLTAAAVKEFGITVNGRTRNAVERAGRIAARAVRVWKAGGGNADAAFDAIAEMTRPVTPASAVKNQVRRATGQVEDTITITAQEALRRLYAAEARAAKAAARMTQQELTALKRTLANEVAAALPLAERGKFLKAIANVKDEKHLKRQLERLKVAVAVADKRAAVQELRKMIKRLPDIDKMRPEYARKVEAVLDAIDTGKMTEKTRRELESMKKYILENPNNEVPADEIERLARLDKTSVADMTAEEVRAKVALLAMYVAQNALKNKLLAGQRARVYAVMKAAMLGELAGKTDLEDRALGIRKGLAAVGRVLGGSGEVAPNIERSVMQKYFGEFSTRPEQLLAEVGESFRELVWENIGVQGWRRELELTQREQDKVFARMRAAGLPFGPGASRAENKAFSDWLNTRVEVTLGGRKARLRMGEAVYIYELSLDPDRRDRLVNTKGLRVERLGARAVYKPDEAELDALPGVIGAEGLALAEAHRETYNGELRRDLNKEWVDVHFHEVAPNTDYTPSRADSLSRRKTIDEMVRENRAISIEGRGMFKPRDNSATAGLLIRDAMAVWEEHLTATAKATAYLKAQHDFNVLMSDPDIQREMTAKYGEDFLRYLKNKVIDQVMGMRPNADLNAAETFVRGLLGRAAVSALSLRISTPLLNFASLPLSATWLKNPLRMARAAAEVPARAGERERIEKAALRFSPYFRARYEGFFKNITSGLFGESETTYGVKPLTEYGLAGIEATDRLCGLIRWRAIELDLRASRKDLKPGTDAFYREVAQEWERMMYRTENTSHAMEMSGFIEMGRKNPMAAGLALFQSASSKLYSNARRAVWLAARGEKRAAAVVFGGVSLAIAAAALIRAAIHEAQGDDDDDKKKAGLAVTAATEALSILPVGGEVAGGMVRSLSTGRNAFTGRTVTGDFAGAVTGVGLGVIKTGSALLEGNSDSKGNPEWHKDAKKLAENTTKAVALSTGLPYGGVEQIGKIGLNVFGGKTADEVMDEIIKEKGLDPSDEIDSKAVSVQRNNAFRAITRGDQSGFDRAALGVVEAGGDVSFPAFFNDLKRRHDKVLTIKSRLGADTELLGADARALIDAEWASFEAEVEVLRGLYGNLPAEVREAWEKKMTERLKIGE